MVTGLAWTALGGAVLDLEAARVHAKSRGFRLTGQPGEVMKESAEIAYSDVAGNLDRFGAPADFFDNAFVHLHVPEGPTPKDGPSASIAMAGALLSLARGRQVPRPLVMTGKIKLTGRVLAIGGVREKLTAARRRGITEVTLAGEQPPGLLRSPASPPGRAPRSFRDALRGGRGAAVWRVMESGDAASVRRRGVGVWRQPRAAKMRSRMSSTLPIPSMRTYLGARGSPPAAHFE
jgi:hypothetical protein